MMDYQVVFPDRRETLVLGKLFYVAFRGEIGIGVPYTGIYLDDTRYIDYYAIKEGDSPISPRSVVSAPDRLEYLYETVDVVVRRRTKLFYTGLREEILFEGPYERFSLEFRPDFSDIFYVRSLVSNADTERWLSKHTVTTRRRGNVAIISCKGTDKVIRHIRLMTNGRIRGRGRRIVVEPVSPKLDVEILFGSSRDEKPGLGLAVDSVYSLFPKFATDNAALQSLYNHSYMNLVNTLESPASGSFFPLGGIPWFHTIFGRDSAITSLHTVLFMPQISASTIAKLGSLIGRKVDARREEEPGKIVHEVRVGEKSAHSVFGKYYGSVDSTPLYVMLYMSYLKHNLPDDVTSRYRRCALAALRWVWRKVREEGLLGYTGGRLANQAWKDSWDSVSDSEGKIPPHPLYLVEVQGYAYRALKEGASLVEDKKERGELLALADKLLDQIENRYWSSKMGYYGEAIDGRGRLADIVTSNPGHLLWVGAVSAGRAKKVAEKLVDRETLNSGFGVKTLSFKEKRHDPFAYHNGSVWPHDNFIILSGLLSYGLVEEASTILSGLLDAYRAMRLQGLPELFSGQRREEISAPTPMGCFPIAWCDAGIFGVIRSMLGLNVSNDGAERLVSISPVLPAGVGYVSVKGISVLGGKLDVSVRRIREGEYSVSHSFTREPPVRVKVEHNTNI